MMWRPQHIDKEMNRMNLEWRTWIDKLRTVVKELIPDAKVKVDLTASEVEEVTFIVECNELPNTDILGEVLRREVLRKSSLPFYSPFKIILRNSKGGAKEINIP